MKKSSRLSLSEPEWDGGEGWSLEGKGRNNC